MTRRPVITTISASSRFLRVLVRGLMERYGASLADALILLPTNRSVAALREEFLAAQRLDDNAATLLPHIKPLSEIDEDELSLTGDAATSAAIAGLPPAITPMRRRFLLMQLILRLQGNLSKAEAFRLADDLGGLIDQSIIEGCSLQALEHLVPEDYARHWQDIRAFLAIIHQHWPLILAAEGKIDQADRTQRLTRVQIEHWKNNPPDFPVIIAGSTGSRPVTAELMQVVASLPHGAIVLPGLDQKLEEEAWALLDETHPQYLMAQFLRRCSVTRDDVADWAVDAPETDRALLLTEALRPAAFTDRWRQLTTLADAGFPARNLATLAAPTEHQEALVAALMLRQCAENPDCTAALVTPDRAIAARVAALMRRWGIEVNDSAGVKLARLPPAIFFTLLLDAADDQLKPSGFIALLKHPFTGMGMTRVECLTAARALEHGFFRTQLCGTGLRQWSVIAGAEQHPLLKTAYNILAPLREAPAQTIEAWLKALLLAATNAAADPHVIWRGEEGVALAQLIEGMSEAAGDARYDFREFVGLFGYALEKCPVRPVYGQHPRLHILGTLEARLLSFDRLILAGLNEGIWPPDHAPDPWMNRAMRSDIGLVSETRAQGQMAHDFTQFIGQPHVTLLRAERRGDAPTIPSRWWLRIEAVMDLLGGKDVLKPKDDWLGWATALDQSTELAPCEPPAMRIPAAAIPRTVSASDLGLWVQDPYAFYAKKVLRLKALDGLDAEFGPRERGNLLHDVLAKLAADYPQHWPPEAIPAFMDAMQKGLHAYHVPAEQRAVIATRLPVLAQEYYVFERERRAAYGPPMVECKGELNIAGIKMIARADRIDRAPDGTLVILDYKTGKIPKDKDLELGLKPQMPLEAVIAEAGGFADIERKPVAALEHVAIKEGPGEFEGRTHAFAVDDVKTIHLPGITNFIQSFLADPVFHAVPRPQIFDPAPDYARLARVAEWSKGALEQKDAD